MANNSYKPRTQKQFDEEFGFCPSPNLRFGNGASCNDEACIVYCPKCNGRMTARIGRRGIYFHCDCTKDINPWQLQQQRQMAEQQQQPTRSKGRPLPV